MFQKLLQILKKNHQTIAFAESCTGGLLSSSFTEISGVSEVFKGSVVAYANEVKEDLLSVSKKSLESEGAVSEAVALQMAHGVRNKMKTSWGVAITGIAGPNGGTKEKPVGTVCFAVVGPHFEKTIKKRFSGDRIEIQKQSVNSARELIEESLK
ncbi:MAG TPA: CinA family protein [Pseudobdellovibrionaceae bacterium]|nr:CinA family protein [Pseudobdellovibrionaceae bacterium]